MTSLSAFLCQNAIQNEHIYYPVSPRFLDESNKPVEWELRCITSAEDEALRRDCTKRVPVPGRKGQYTQDVDFNLYLGKLRFAVWYSPIWTMWNCKIAMALWEQKRC